uniref:HhH-GPD domain-containing protein n=1 Tax=Leersia perrieri TaxID=77586 RepID=A0A0D9XDT4_9ORYZ
MLVLSGALAEMTWPTILSKRETFREVFMDFDPLLVAKLSEKKILGPCSPARSLLSEHRLRTIIENAQEVLKVIEEFGSFDNYCWSFLNSKPMIGRFRNPREVPLKTPKADAISQDLLRRGFLGVGPTVIYAFMQAVGMANDHLVTCYRFDECCSCSEDPTAMDGIDNHNKSMVKDQEMNMMCGLVECVSLEPSRARATTVISIS